MPKKIEVTHIGYVVEGTAHVTLWDDTKGDIEMKPTTLHHIEYPTKDQIKSVINDNGFGCKSIDGADVEIYELYQYDVKIHVKTLYLESKDCRDGKRGI